MNELQQTLQMKVANMLRELMQEKGINQTQLTKRMSAAAGYEIKRSVVNRALSGTVNMTLDTIKLFAIALDVEIIFTTRPIDQVSNSIKSNKIKLG